MRLILIRYIFKRNKKMYKLVRIQRSILGTFKEKNIYASYVKTLHTIHCLFLPYEKSIDCRFCRILLGLYSRFC